MESRQSTKIFQNSSRDRSTGDQRRFVKVPLVNLVRPLTVSLVGDRATTQHCSSNSDSIKQKRRPSLQSPLVESWCSRWIVMDKELVELPEPGFWLPSVMVCAIARSDAGMATCKWALSMKVVVQGDPFRSATASGRNPVPVTVRYRLPLPT